MAQATHSNRVFDSVESMHVFSHFDLVFIQQGGKRLQLPAELVPCLLEALRLAAEGEI